MNICTTLFSLVTFGEIALKFVEIIIVAQRFRIENKIIEMKHPIRRIS